MKSEMESRENFILKMHEITYHFVDTKLLRTMEM